LLDAGPIALAAAGTKLPIHGQLSLTQERDVAGELNLFSRFGTNSENIGTAVREPVPAAQYVRMSTEHQRYSTENQSDAILQYAVRYSQRTGDRGDSTLCRSVAIAAGHPHQRDV
jgi:hypothetical protein